MSTTQIELIDENVVQQVAKIMGASSAAQKALDDAKARRDRGQEVVFGRYGSSILVVQTNAPTQ